EVERYARGAGADEHTCRRTGDAVLNVGRGPQPRSAKAIEVRIRLLLIACVVRAVVANSVVRLRLLLLAARERAQPPSAWQKRRRIEEDRGVTATFGSKEERWLHRVSVRQHTQAVVV